MVRGPDDESLDDLTRTLARPVVPVRLNAAGDRGYVGRFEVRGILGRGGMGIVYDAIDTESRAACALKMIGLRFLQLDDLQAAERFVHEIKVLEQLSHPGVVRFREYGLADTGEAEHSAFFVMERLRGRTIGQALHEGRRFTLDESLRLTGAVSEALAYLDAKKVLHRDIKPGNVFMDETGRVVLMDFGLARSEHFTKLTRAGHIVGTVFYMSPERLKGEASDIRSDVFALGVVLYEMLIGRRPHTEEDPTSLLRAIRRGISWPSESGKNPGERAARELIDAMCAPEAEQRPTPQKIAERCRSIVESIALVPTSSNDPTLPSFSVQPQMPPPVIIRPGPTWTTSLLITITFSLLTFLGGLLLGTNRSHRTVAISRHPIPEASSKEVVVEPHPKLEFSSAEEAYRYGDERLKAGDHTASIQALEQALNLNPAYADAYRRLGDACLSAGQIDKAREAYERYRKLRPDAPDAAAIEKLLQSFE